MRQIVLDTETTGLNARLGDRVIEIGCVEIESRRLTGNRFHRYVNPERDIEEGAMQVHGLSSEFLQDKPRFAEIAAEFLEYVAGAELVIHNAAFDVEFLNVELGLLGLPPLDRHVACIVDTLKTARELHPGKKNSLDALCERYAIDNSSRTLHGALLDAELLAEVYLAMTRGQESLGIELNAPAAQVAVIAPAGGRIRLVRVAATPEEIAEHESVLAGIRRDSKGKLVWATPETARG